MKPGPYKVTLTSEELTMIFESVWAGAAGPDEVTSGELRLLAMLREAMGE